MPDIHDDNYRLIGRCSNGEIHDANYRLVGRYRNGEIHDANYRLVGRYDGSDDGAAASALRLGLL
jgi:hypothetical protein